MDTYNRGTMFEIVNAFKLKNTYILSTFKLHGEFYAVLISLGNGDSERGNRWNSPMIVDNLLYITQEDLDYMLNGNKNYKIVERFVIE